MRVETCKAQKNHNPKMTKRSTTQSLKKYTNPNGAHLTNCNALLNELREKLNVRQPVQSIFGILWVLASASICKKYDGKRRV